MRALPFSTWIRSMSSSRASSTRSWRRRNTAARSRTGTVAHSRWAARARAAAASTSAGVHWGRSTIAAPPNGVWVVTRWASPEELTRPVSRRLSISVRPAGSAGGMAGVAPPAVGPPWLWTVDRASVLVMWKSSPRFLRWWHRR